MTLLEWHVILPAMVYLFFVVWLVNELEVFITLQWGSLQGWHLKGEFLDCLSWEGSLDLANSILCRKAF